MLVNGTRKNDSKKCKTRAAFLYARKLYTGLERTIDNGKLGERRGWRRFPLLATSVILFCAALSLDLYRLGTPSLWFDEAFSVELARQPLPLLWHIIFGPEPNMELYYLLLHYWLAFTAWLGFNPTEFIVRFPSAIFAALSAVAVFLLGRRFIGTGGGIVGSALYLLNDLQLTYAQQTRSYSLQLLLTCLAWYALLVAMTTEARQKRWWIGYSIMTALAVYVHLFSMLVLLAQVVAVGGLLVVGRRSEQARGQIVAFGGSLLAIGVLIIPMWLVSLQGARTGWLPMPNLSDIVSLFVTIGGQHRFYVVAFMACAGLTITGVAASYCLPLMRGKFEHSAVGKLLLSYRRWQGIAWVLLCWFLIPLLVSFVVSHGATRLFSSRYLVVILPPLFLLVGLGIVMLRWRVIQLALALVVMLLAVSAVPFYYRNAQVEDWRSTTSWLEQHYQAGDGLVCYDNDLEQGCQIATEYYLHAYPGQAHFTADAPGAFSWEKYGPARLAGPEEAVDPAALAAYGAKHPRLFFIVGRVPDDAAAARARAAQQWLNNNYQFVDQIVTPTVTIRLYITG
ncbi:MAG TPA: glycosyltransferase family 39 protein [Ktedonobacteraceae bacterium]|nr:glycosyltransferase family 39 protein [Ktedonobacteraceae bacterium]